MFGAIFDSMTQLDWEGYKFAVARITTEMGLTDEEQLIFFSLFDAAGNQKVKKTDLIEALVRASRLGEQPTAENPLHASPETC